MSRIDKLVNAKDIGCLWSYQSLVRFTYINNKVPDYICPTIGCGSCLFSPIEGNIEEALNVQTTDSN